jgi:hypothetical protein
MAFVRLPVASGERRRAFNTDHIVAVEDGVSGKFQCNVVLDTLTQYTVWCSLDEALRLINNAINPKEL